MEDKKYIGKLYNKKVYIVDGSEVRKNKKFADFFDTAFYGVSIKGTLADIPKDEIWIANEIDNDERKAELVAVAEYLKLLSAGEPPNKAYEQSRKIERQIRKKYNIFTEDDVEIRTIANIKGLTIKLVNGKAVRNLLDDDFAQGGHDRIYEYIPKKEIWIDNTLDKSEYLTVIIHEYVERFLMNGGYNYDVAHEIATHIEYRNKEND